MPHRERSSVPNPDAPSKVAQQSEDNDVFDLLGIGFGPASLAIAIALHDILEERADKGSASLTPKVKFLEQQASFAWHAGMLLPGTKMQISFIKDLATMRNPRSHFTFLNYLRHHDRLVHFCNLDTFLPLRTEFEDYLKWCARHFSDFVRYNLHVTSVKPLRIDGSTKVNCLEIGFRNSVTGVTGVQRSRNIVIAVGGRPFIPPVFPHDHSKIIHSSRYNQKIEEILPDKNSPYTIAVVGAGQSAAEVFNDLQHRFPNAKTNLIMRDTALRPSDDSPFVNEVFNPEAVDKFYSNDSETRHAQLRANKATNYSVIRLTLLEEIYQNLYQQRLREPNPQKWQHRILADRTITGVSDSSLGETFLAMMHDERMHALNQTDRIQVDAIILATGYMRDVHKQILKECDIINGSQDGTWVAQRDYQVQLNRDLVDSDVSIYLQGCNEQTHGLSDTLLSVLATRGGEVAESVLGKARVAADSKGSLGGNSFFTSTIIRSTRR